MSDEPKNPPVAPDHLNIQLKTNDWESLIKLLNLTSDTFTKIVANALLQEDKVSYDVFLARAKLSNMFSETIGQNLDIGEPESRESH